MSVSRNESDGLPRSAESHAIENHYHWLSRVVLGSVRSKYSLSESEADDLIQEAFQAYLNVVAPTSETLEWVTASIWTRAEILYGKRVGKPLPPNAQKALRLYTEDRFPYEQIAKEMNISAYAARRLVERALERLGGEPGGPLPKE